MQIITDKIPAMAKLNATIAEIKELLGYSNEEVDVTDPSYETTKKPPLFWIAGGAITAAVTGAKINDYDLFSPEPHKVVEILKKEVGYCTFETEHFVNFWINGCKVQVILRYAPEDPNAIFETFDFTIVCGAYNGTTFYCHDRFWQDIASKRLVVNKLYFPLRSMERMAKYSGRGYTPCPFGLLELAKTINRMTIDWDNPSENDLSFYSDGTPRFNGPD